jgi:hypothetical protein
MPEGQNLSQSLISGFDAMQVANPLLVRDGGRRNLGYLHIREQSTGMDLHTFQRTYAHNRGCGYSRDRN